MPGMANPTTTILLGFDFGTKRIGVAVGQMITRTAKPLPHIAVTHGNIDWQLISQLISDWRATALVVGIPLNMDGTTQTITLKAEQFMQQLAQHTQLPVYGCDERLSTVDARSRVFEAGGYRALQNTQIDSVAAKIILESWMAEQP